MKTINTSIIFFMTLILINAVIIKFLIVQQKPCKIMCIKGTYEICKLYVFFRRLILIFLMSRY